MYEDMDYGYTYSDAADSAYDVSSSWATSANDAYVAGDMNGYTFMDGQADSWDSYGSNMEYLANDPTDSTAWSDAWSDATQASNEAWNASVDAYVAGDTELSYQLNDYSIAADSAADATWDAWGSATSADSTYSGYDSAGYAGYDSAGYAGYDTSSYSGYDTSSSYDTTSSYDSGYDSSGY